MATPYKRSMSSHDLVDYLLGRPGVYVIKTQRRTGPSWSLSTLVLVNGAACEWLIGRGILVERDLAVISDGPTNAQSYELASGYRERFSA